MPVINVVFYVTDFSSRKIRRKITTKVWNMQGLDEKNRILLRFFVFSIQIFDFRISSLTNSLIH